MQYLRPHIKIPSILRMGSTTNPAAVKVLAANGLDLGTLSQAVNDLQREPVDKAGRQDLRIVGTRSMEGLIGTMREALMIIEQEDGEQSPCLSRQLQSCPVAVHTSDGMAYMLHSHALMKKSEYFQTCLSSDFATSNQLKVMLDEDSKDFKYFIAYIYGRWNLLTHRINGQELIRLTELYAMGERLLASEFQVAIGDLIKLLFMHVLVESKDMCVLLRIAASAITEKVSAEDQIRDLIFCKAAYQLTGLQSEDEFKQLLLEESDVGRQLALRAGECVRNPAIPDVRSRACKKRKHK